MCNLSGAGEFIILKGPSYDSTIVDPTTDTQIMIDVRDGDVGKLGLLFERHHGALFGYFVRLTMDRDLSQDMVQEVFLRLLKYRHTFRGDGQFLTWVYSIARNVHFDNRKHWDREMTLNEEHHDRPAEDPTPGAIAEREQEIALLKAALAKLPVDKRDILILSRYQELKYSTIAELLGCSVEAVKVRVHRAVNELRAIYLELAGENNP